MQTYNKSLNRYEAKYNEIKEKIRLEYKNREHKDCYGKPMTIKDWTAINKDLKERHYTGNNNQISDSDPGVPLCKGAATKNSCSHKPMGPRP